MRLPPRRCRQLLLPRVAAQLPPPPPPTAGSSDGGGEDALSAFLAQHSLAGLAAPLSELGVEAPADLLELDEEDVASLKLKKVQTKKWARAIASLG